jgi:hypothetical protein
MSLRGVSTPSDQYGQHLAILDPGILQRLCLDAQRAAVEEEVLRTGGEVGLGLDKALEILHGEPRRQVQGEQVVLRGLILGVDGYGDAWPS